MSRGFDVIVAGGGAAGALAAGLLGRQGLKVALVDPRQPRAPESESEIDPRVVAISPGSRNVLKAGGAWRRLDPDRVGVYTRMQVHAGRGRLEFRAADHGLDALGWIIELPAIAAAAWADLEARDEVERIQPGRIRDLELGPDAARLALEGGRRLKAHILVAADGGKSRLRARAGIEARTWHYNQKAVVCHLSTSVPNPGIAWQRFTEAGPLALLPLADGRSSLVYSVPANRAEELLALADDEFLAHLAEACENPPFGEFSAATERHALPLARREAATLRAGRMVLLGDAARTVHPLAGQGLNLGIADAAALAEALQGFKPGEDPGRRLDSYARRRISGGTLIGAGIHAFNELTVAGGSAGKSLFGLGFSVVDRLWPVRDAFVRRACGIDFSAPKLARKPGVGLRT